MALKTSKLQKKKFFLETLGKGCIILIYLYQSKYCPPFCSSSQLDSDGDGVSDDKDQCNDTPDGVTVDENGCPLNPIYLDQNGVTVKCYEWGKVGDTGEINGVTYTIVDETMLYVAFIGK